MSDYQFECVDNPRSLLDLRNLYLNGLPHSQDYFVELQVKQARWYLIKSGSTRTGYFILSNDGCLLEYFMLPEWANQEDVLLGNLIEKYSIRKALCKSYDAFLLSSCYQYQKKSRAIGILFPEIQSPRQAVSQFPFSIRHAVPADEPMIVSINENVFDSAKEVMEYIESSQIFLYEKENDLIGFGIYSQIIEGRPARDIGMLVVPAFRNKGYGCAILQHLIQYCRQNQWPPQAGCDIENTASRHCLEKAGFIPRYRLLEFTF
ncbi:GNAT family N-acetyltransferase [Leptolinea tardivitalis]|uniref:N-acetyltransferase domain-containing protein n=1 Tax=Leptolinea tardivitalis TaxID=229920 RepID=A0A0P6XQT2_9CHLR|nr:GNAT family N-acetyltransferase [Leptolinea tardivitalis]KPL71865.1 hypothetical protein ADM99_10670 [Leptolinea tardivitalis]GAP20267.1 acetyltransferase [Leptolinea tardivitalis]